MVEALSVDIIDGGHQADDAVNFGNERLFFSETSPPAIYCVEVTGICISLSPRKMDGVVRLDDGMPVSGQESFCQQPAVRMQDGFRQAIESHDHIGLCPIKDLVVRREANVIGLSHSAIP